MHSKKVAVCNLRGNHSPETVHLELSLPSSLRNWVKINFCCLSPLVYGILLQQPELSNISTKVEFIFILNDYMFSYLLLNYFFLLPLPLPLLSSSSFLEQGFSITIPANGDKICFLPFPISLSTLSLTRQY